jgi:hypothetical protein
MKKSDSVTKCKYNYLFDFKLALFWTTCPLPEIFVVFIGVDDNI